MSYKTFDGKSARGDFQEALLDAIHKAERLQVYLMTL